MKHKFWIVLLTILATLCISVGLAACGDKGGNASQGGNNTSQADPKDDDEIDEDKSLEYLEFELSSTGSYYVVRGIRTQDTDKIVIPSTYNGKVVAEIGDGAFSGWQNLQSVRIPDSILLIRENAFNYCTSLTSIEIPVNVKNCTLAFNFCTELKTIYWNAIDCRISSDGEYGEFRMCPAITTVIFGDDVQYIPNIFKSNYLGDKRTNLTSITIGKSVTKVTAGTFQHCENLKTVYWNAKNGDWSFSGYYADSPLFKGCTALTTVIFGNDVKKISDNMFNGCTNLNSVSMSNSITTIGDYAFNDCRNLAGNINLDGVTSIGEDAFYNCTSLNGVSMNSLTSIGNYAFSGCKSLTSITIPDSVTSIGNYAFSGCKSLETVYWNATNCTSAGSSYPIFNGCTALTTVIIGDNVLSIPDYAFSGCSSLTSVTIPGSVTTIGSSAFRGCTSLTSITISDSVTSIGNSAFSGCTSLETVYWNATNCTSAGSSYPIFNGCTALTTVIIGDNVLSIPDYAFRDCTSLTNVIIGNNVTSIGSSAFNGCASLTNITIPDSVIFIGYRAFYNCTKLASVTFENTTGWKGFDSSTATNGGSISSSSLANASTAAKYLTDAYHSYYWKRS